MRRHCPRLGPLLLLLLCTLPAGAVAQPNLKLTIGENDVDVANRRIHFSLGTIAVSAQIKVFTPDGKLLHEHTETYGLPDPNTRLAVDWPDLGKEGENFKIELKITDEKGYWIGFEVIRFYLEIPHEDVAFASARWNIAADEEPKLVEPLAKLKEAVRKYAKLMDVRLYVAGHTDTVGSPGDNQLLSEKRARSIATYFIDNGLRGLPIFVRGFGEGAPAVKTADSVAEKRNRRAQYIISTFTPEVAGPGQWSRLQ